MAGSFRREERGAVAIDPLAGRRRRGRSDRHDRELAERRRVSLKRKLRSDIAKKKLVLARGAGARTDKINFGNQRARESARGASRARRFPARVVNRLGSLLSGLLIKNH